MNSQMQTSLGQGLKGQDPGASAFIGLECVTSGCQCVCHSGSSPHSILQYFFFFLEALPCGHAKSLILFAALSLLKRMGRMSAMKISSF